MTYEAKKVCQLQTIINSEISSETETESLETSYDGKQTCYIQLSNTYTGDCETSD